MLNKDIQRIRMNVIEILLLVCRENPEKMYIIANEYLELLNHSLEQHKEFYNQKFYIDK